MFSREFLVRAFLLPQRILVTVMKRFTLQLIIRGEEPIEQRRERSIRRRIELVQRAPDDRNAGRGRARNIVDRDGSRRRFGRRRSLRADRGRDFLNGRVLLVRRELQKLIANRHRFVADRENSHLVHAPGNAA
ncbi:hypothetical protein [Bradyrhizobium embrapense]